MRAHPSVERRRAYAERTGRLCPRHPPHGHGGAHLVELRGKRDAGPSELHPARLGRCDALGLALFDVLTPHLRDVVEWLGVFVPPFSLLRLGFQA